MKSLILTVTLLNFMIYFPYNGSQEIYNQTNQHFSANSPLSSSDNHTASQISAIQGYAVPTEVANSYSVSTDTVKRLSGFLPERNHSETLQANIHNFPPFGDNARRNSSASQTSASFDYVEGTVDNFTQTEAPINNASPSSDAMQDTSADSITISSFAPNSRITQGWVSISGENSISAPVSMTTHQLQSESTAIPQFQIDSKAIQSLEPFFPSTGSFKPFFASNPAAYIQNPKYDFTASEEESTIAISNAKSLLGTDSTTHEEEARPDSISFTNSIALMAESNTEKIDATDILEGYVTSLDVPDLEDNSMSLVDTTYLERYSETVNNAPDLPKKDNFIEIDVTGVKNDGRAIVNTRTPSIFSPKKSNDFAFVTTLSTYDKAGTKTITIATDINDAMSNINPITTTNSFLNDRMHKKSNIVTNDSTDNKTTIDVAKNAMQVGDLNISPINGIISTKHYANSNPVDPFRNDGTLFTADASNFIEPLAPFVHPQATNPVKKTSLADITMPKAFHNKATPAALTLAVTMASQGDGVTKFYIPRYELEDSFIKDTTLNYEEDLPKEVGIMAEEEDTIQEENVNQYNYITSIASDNVPKDSNLAAKHYSISPDVYDFTRFRGTTKTTADQPRFGNPAYPYMAEVSKPLLGKLTPKFQGNMIAMNFNSGADHGVFFDDDILYSEMKENIPKGYIAAPEKESIFTMDPALEGTVLLGKETFSKNYASNTDKRIDLGTKKDQIITGSITNSHVGNIPVTSFTSVSSEDINMEDYSHISRTGTPLSLGYTNTLVDDSFILRSGPTLAKENNLGDVNLIITGPDKIDSEYISSKYAFELMEEENSPIKKTTSFTYRPNGFTSHTPSSNAEVSRSLLYRITHPEVETKEKYETIISKERISDSDIVATTFKDYNKNINSPHLRIMMDFPIDAGETLSSDFLKILSGRQDTLSADDVIIIPQVYDLGNKNINHPFGAETEMIIMEESRTLRADPMDHAMITIPIKRQGHFYRKGISFNAYNITAPKLEDTITSEKSKVSGDKMNLAEMILLEDHINPVAQENAPQADNSYVNDLTNSLINTGSVPSLYPVNAIKMPPSATTISPNAHAFASKKSNENGGYTNPEDDGALSINLKSLLIHNQKRPGTAVILSENDDSFSDTSVTLEGSEPLGEYTAIIDQNWEITKTQNDLQPFSMVSSVPLADPTTFSENPINVATDKSTTENGGINDNIETMGFSPQIALQPGTHKKEGINKTSDDDISHQVNQAVIPFMEGIIPSETQANTFLSKDKVIENKPPISEANIPVNLREVTTVKVNPFILTPDVASAEWKAPGTSKEAFYPDSTMSTTELTIAGTRGSSFLNNENTDRSITNSYKNSHHLPLISTLPHTDYTIISNSEIDPTLILGRDNIEITDDSLIANSNSIIILPNGKRMEDLFVPEPELITAMGESRMFTTDSIDPAVIRTPLENKDQFNRKVISSAFYNNAIPDGTKATKSARLDANNDKANLADMAHSQNSIISFNVIPNGDHPFISKDTEEANSRTSIFSTSMNKATSIMADSIALSNVGNYEGGDSMLPRENVKSRGFPSQSTSAMLIPIAITENPETPDLRRYNSLSKPSLAGSEMLEIITEYADAINGGDVPEGEIIITQTDIQSNPLAWNAPQTVFTTFTENPTGGEVESFFSLSRETPDHYKTKTDEIYYKPQRAFSPREDSQNSIYVKRKIANLSDQENPTAKFELSHFTDATVLIPTMEKILLSATEPNTLSKSDNSVEEKGYFSEAGNTFSIDASTLKEDPFSVKYDVSLARFQAPPNLKGIFSGDSTLILPEAPRPNDQSFASLDKVTSTGGFFTNTATRSYGLPWKSILPPSDFTTLIGTPKYSEIVHVTTVEKDITTKIDSNAPLKETMTPLDQFTMLPITIASEKDMPSTFNKNIFGHKNFREREMDNGYETIYSTENNSERVDDISSTDKLIPAYMDHVNIMIDDSGSDYVSSEDAFESEKQASNSLIKLGTLTYAPKTHGSFVPYITAAASDNLTKTKPSEFKTKENYQTIIPRQEHKNFDIDAIALKDSPANVNSKAHSPTTNFLIDTSGNFPPNFPDKTSVGKSTINGDDDTVILYDGSDFGNKINEYSFVPGIESIVESRTFTTDATNPAVKIKDHVFRESISPIIYNTFTPITVDTTKSTISEFAEDESDIAVVSESSFNVFSSTQLSVAGISSVAENTKGAISTALTSFAPLKEMPAITPNVPAISIKDKNYIGHSSPPSSEDVMSLRFTSMGQPEALLLAANVPTKETVAPKLVKGTSVYHPLMLLAASEPESTYSAHFNEGVVPEVQNTKNQMVSKAQPLVYTVLQTDFSRSSDKTTDVEPNISALIASKDNIYGIGVSGGLNIEPKERTFKFSTLFPDKYNVPNFYDTWRITKASAVKDTVTEFQVNPLTDINIIGDDSVTDEINSLRDADLKSFLVNKNVIHDKSNSKDYDSVPTATYSSFLIPKDSLPAGYVSQEANFMTGNSNLPMQVVTIIPTDEKSSSSEIISLVEGDSRMEFDAANLRAANTEFQALESPNISHKPIFEIEKILPKFQEISIVPQNNKEFGEDTFFKAGIPRSRIEIITQKDIPVEPTDMKADMRVMTDPAVNAISLGNKEIISSLERNMLFNYNLLRPALNHQSNRRKEDETVIIEVAKPQNFIAPLASFAVSDGKISFLNEVIEPEASSATPFQQ